MSWNVVSGRRKEKKRLLLSVQSVEHSQHYNSVITSNKNFLRLVSFLSTNVPLSSISNHFIGCSRKAFPSLVSQVFNWMLLPTRFVSVVKISLSQNSYLLFERLSWCHRLTFCCSELDATLTHRVIVLLVTG